MRNRIYRTALEGTLGFVDDLRQSRKLHLFLTLALALASTSTSAQVNSWTSLTSSNWDEPANWSLGILPNSSQSILITNAGWKAVAINPSTPVNFPGSMTVSNLFVAAPTNGLNNLLLNYAGLNTPFKVLNKCVIGTNGTIANYYSSFEVDGSGLLVDADTIVLPTGGSFTQIGGNTVVNGPMFLRSGLCNSSNGNLTLGDFTIGTTTPSFAFGYFTQQGGSLLAQRLTLEAGAYTLESGTLYAIGGTYIGGFANLNHNGGTNYGDITITNGSGSYRVGGGLAKGNLLTVASDFEQHGGVVDMQVINWFGHIGGLYGGTLRCETFNVSGTAELGIGTQWPFPPGSVNAGSFNISGTASVTVDTGYGINVTNNIDVHGDSSSADAMLTMYNANLSVSNLTTHEHSRVTFGGSGQIFNRLFVEGGEFVFGSGTLDSPDIQVNLNARLAQVYGKNSVHGVLSITGQYDLGGGNLTVAGLYLRGSLLLEPPPSPLPDPSFVLTFTNTGLADLGGYLGIGMTNAQGGQVRLSTNAAIDFIGTPARIQFANSSAIAWTSGAHLVISHWNNSGAVRIFFGNNASALSASQLSQIIFTNPGGYPAGNYPAQLLSTGELIPGPLPTLQFSGNGSALVMSWTGNYQLLSSTNVAGPYAPVTGATSPWTNSFAKPREYFRLQKY